MRSSSLTNHLGDGAGGGLGDAGGSDDRAFLEESDEQGAQQDHEVQAGLPGRHSGGS